MTVCWQICWEVHTISIHTFLAEGDSIICWDVSGSKYFNPHLPCGRWQLSMWWAMATKNFNPHLPCGRWRLILVATPCLSCISIHTFLAEGDAVIIERYFDLTISIHTFLAEGDSVCIWMIRLVIDFNPHLPCGRWRYALYTSISVGWISIHTFLAEGDETGLAMTAKTVIFQSTPSLRKVTTLTMMNGM